MSSMLARHTHLFLALLLLCVGAAQVGAASSAGAIKHVITLMMENHSFNNLLGWLPGIGDVLPSDYNLLNTSDPNSPKLFASDGAPFCAMADLLHDFVDVQEQVFGGAATAANMGGFVHNYAAHGGTAAVPMACFTPQQLPVISALCSSFTCATRFHSSIPGPTGPNRMMLHAATTTGYDGGQFDIGPFHMHARTIYEDLQADGRTWRIHWQDFTTAHAITPLSASPNTSAYITRDVAFTNFFDALERGTLPDYTLLVPALGPLNTSSGAQAPNSQHPAYDIRHGEELIKQVKVKKPRQKTPALASALPLSAQPQTADPDLRCTTACAAAATGTTRSSSSPTTNTAGSGTGSHRPPTSPTPAPPARPRPSPSSSIAWAFVCPLCWSASTAPAAPTPPCTRPPAFLPQYAKSSPSARRPSAPALLQPTPSRLRWQTLAMMRRCPCQLLAGAARLLATLPLLC